MFAFLDQKRSHTHPTRRDFLRAGVAGTLWPGAVSARANRTATAKSVILFWLDGGLSHLESYDPKPDAPADNRGPFGTMTTRVPGIRIVDQLPGHARHMKKLALLRSVHHECGEHWSGPHTMLTGVCGPTFVNPAQTHPSAGSIVARALGPIRPNMPAYVATPFTFHSFQQMAPGYHGSLYLGAKYTPFSVIEPRQTYMLKGDELKPPGLKLPADVDGQRIEERGGLLRSLDRQHRVVDASGTREAQLAEAFSIISDRACHNAFDLERVDPRNRDHYGRNYLGQSALLARRLVEAGVRFVTICHRDWDHHSEIEKLLRIDLPRLDQALSSLIDDLEDCGMLDDVLILVMGDFGRTPLINKTAGRDHWAHAGSVLMAGGGVKGGQAIGATNSRGERPIERPITPADIWATAYQALGIDPATHFPDQARRLMPITTGEVIHELF
ncbi:MAG: DUF1501 domain-containing protein [Planctomycetes bacterium]|nr:DUF1501 domain-containing protein [Planctomycetota bacterium]